MHQMPDTQMQYNQFLLGQHLIHPQAYSKVTPVYFPHSCSYNWEYQYWPKIQNKLTLQFCKILYIHNIFFCLIYVASSPMRKGSIMHHRKSTYDDISLTTHDRNYQEFETKRNNLIILLKLRICRLKDDSQRLDDINWNL